MTMSLPACSSLGRRIALPAVVVVLDEASNDLRFRSVLGRTLIIGGASDPLAIDQQDALKHSMVATGYSGAVARTSCSSVGPAFARLEAATLRRERDHTGCGCAGSRAGDDGRPPVVSVS